MKSKWFLALFSILILLSAWGYFTQTNLNSEETTQKSKSQPSTTPVIKQDNLISNRQYLKNKVKPSIVSHFDELQKCYQDYLKTTPDIKKGKLDFQWKILKNGSVSDVLIKNDPFQAPEFSGCISANISRWIFPIPSKEETIMVTHTFNFAG